MQNMFITAIAACLILVTVIMYANESGRQATSPQQVAGEPSVPLVGTEWVWLHTERPDNTLIATPMRESYVLTLLADGRIQSTTDCNIFIGKYEQRDEVLSFGPLASTKKLCSESMETVYAKDLGYTTSYQIMGDRLILFLNRDVGRMIFEQR